MLRVVWCCGDWILCYKFCCCSYVTDTLLLLFVKSLTHVVTSLKFSCWIFTSSVKTFLAYKLLSIPLMIGWLHIFSVLTVLFLLLGMKHQVDKFKTLCLLSAVVFPSLLQTQPTTLVSSLVLISVSLIRSLLSLMHASTTSSSSSHSLCPWLWHSYCVICTL